MDGDLTDEAWESVAFTQPNPDICGAFVFNLPLPVLLLLLLLSVRPSVRPSVICTDQSGLRAGIARRGIVQGRRSTVHQTERRLPTH